MPLRIQPARNSSVLEVFLVNKSQATSMVVRITSGAGELLLGESDGRCGIVGGAANSLHDPSLGSMSGIQMMINISSEAGTTVLFLKA